MRQVLEVLAAGALTTVQDLGRPGYAHLGVPRSGALDQPALRLANRLVGNEESAAALELTVTGCTVRPHRPATVALTGAAADLRVAGRPVPFGAPVPVPAGEAVRVGPARYGVRAYLAVDGGIAVPPVLGSRSTDLLSGLGPPRLRDGMLLPLGPPRPTPSTVDSSPWEAPPSTVELRVRFGPREDWFTDGARDQLCSHPYTISPVSNRIAARLSGAALTRAIAEELPPEGIVLGAVQVPADGQPLVFLADHPVTGGYPVIAVVHPADVSRLAQARPGATVRFCGPQR
jgi:biotin-dependent carboxylase-like uncharacterized protein